MNNTLTRAISGAVYVLLLISATLYSPYSFLLLFGLFLLLAVFEFCRLTQIKNTLPIAIAGIGYIFFNIDNIVFNIENPNKTNQILMLLGAIFVSVKALLFLFEPNNKPIHQGSKYVYLTGYVILPFIIISKLPFVTNNYNPKIIISLFILIWTNDTFAFIVGKSIGKNKLFERISPKKTIEGFLGGLIFSILAGLIIAQYYTEESFFKWATIALLVGIFGTIGDLIESKFKRIAGVKDSGNIMPGHGGVLDRLDSIIFVAPIIYLLYQILYYVS
jgi:phosphatidate cytidylyltransferase